MRKGKIVIIYLLGFQLICSAQIANTDFNLDHGWPECNSPTVTVSKQFEAFKFEWTYDLKEYERYEIRSLSVDLKTEYNREYLLNADYHVPVERMAGKRYEVRKVCFDSNNLIEVFSDWVEIPYLLEENDSDFDDFYSTNGSCSIDTEYQVLDDDNIQYCIIGGGVDSVFFGYSIYGDTLSSEYVEQLYNDGDTICFNASPDATFLIQGFNLNGERCFGEKLNPTECGISWSYSKEVNEESGHYIFHENINGNGTLTYHSLDGEELGHIEFGQPIDYLTGNEYIFQYEECDGAGNCTTCQFGFAVDWVLCTFPFNIIDIQILDYNCQTDQYTLGYQHDLPVPNDNFIEWSTGDTTETIITESGEISILIRGKGRCSGYGTLDLQPYEDLQLILDLPDYCDSQQPVVTPTISGGYGPFSYNWSNGESQASITLLESANNANYKNKNYNYSLTVTDNYGCSTSIEDDFKVMVNPQVNLDSTPGTCENDGEIVLSFQDCGPRTSIEFSLDGGVNYLQKVHDNIGSINYSVEPGNYNVYARWGNDACPVFVGTEQVLQSDSDEDLDGICDQYDECPGFDDNIDFDEDDIPDGCDDCIIGSSCDDNDECTSQDMVQTDCSCLGTFDDSDLDGICDAEDICDGDDMVDSDNDGIPDDCDDCNLSSTPCDDGDPCTIDDTFNDDCDCEGTLLDEDEDTICDLYDNCINTPNIDQADVDSDGIGDMCDEDFLPEFGSDDICNILNLITILNLNDTDLLLSYEGNYEHYLTDQLAELDYGPVNASQILQTIDNIELTLTLNFNNGSTEVSTFNIQDELNQTFDINNWALIIEEVNVLELASADILFQVVINDEVFNCSSSDLLTSDEADDELPEEDPPLVELPHLPCGEEYTPIDLFDVPLIDSLAEGDLLNINGFPLLLADVAKVDGWFHGEGLIPIPFKEKIVYVTFNELQVNDSLQVTGGSISVVSGSPIDYEQFTVDAGIQIGSDICLPPQETDYVPGQVDPVTGLDGYGFDENGIHSETGKPLDERDFDVNGIHANGTPYDDNNCDRDGMDPDGIPCPDFGTNPVVQEFLDSIQTALPNHISGSINSLKNILNDSLLTLDCELLRTETQTIANGLPSEYVFGSSNEYLNEGLHENFDYEPQVMDNDIEGRDPNIIALENIHVDLYHCDRISSKLINLVQDIDQNCASSDFLEGLNEFIITKIESWNESMLSTFGEGENFEAWLTKQIIRFITENDGAEFDDLFGCIDTPNNHIQLNSNKLIPDESYDYYNTIASGQEQLFVYEGAQLENINFQFEQGFEYINGVHRAFYLEELAKMNALSSSGPESLLPVHIQNTIGGIDYDIYLDEMTFGTDGAYLTAYCIIEHPDSGQKIVFKGENIGFGVSGVDGGKSTMSLLSDISLRLSNTAMLHLLGTEDTYISWDCNGFCGAGIDADIELCKDFITPLEADHTSEDGNYLLHVSLEMPAWMEFVAQIDAGSFELTNYPDIDWTLSNLVVDMSSTETPSITPVQGYSSPFGNENGLTGAWKGFYIEEISASMENDFTGGQEATMGASDVLIDGNGVTGSAFYSIDPDQATEGEVGGWPITVDSLAVTVINNQFAGFGMAGLLKVPVMNEGMDYVAIMYPNQKYSFTISPLENGTVDLLLAEAEIYESSSITASYENDEILIVADLSGKLSVVGNEEEDGGLIQVPNIEFTNWKIQNMAPYMSAGNWALSDSIGSDMDGFSLTLKELSMHNAGLGDEYAALGVTLGLNLNDNLSISADGSFDIIGRLDLVDGKQKWNFERVQINGFCAAGSFGVVEDMAVCLNWFNDDPVFGKGFKGAGSMKILKSAGLEMAAQFGKMNGEKYFFVDAMATIGSGIPLGPITLEGFGGGVSYGMDADFDPNTIDFNSEVNPVSLVLGEGLSGVVYTPDVDRGLGLKAGALFSVVGAKSVLNGNLNIGVEFNDPVSTGGGIAEISMYGIAQLLADLDVNLDIPTNIPALNDAIPPPSSVPLAGYIDLNMNFNEKKFDGKIEAFLDAGILKGAGQNNKLVTVDVKFHPGEWYIWIGQPEDRCGAEVNLGIIKGELGAYFDVGSTIPAFPDLPDEVAEVAGLVQTDDPLRNAGSGMVFGARFKVEAKAGIAAIAQATLGADVGFDLSLRKYTNVYCANTGEEVGINGWYGLGQMWAYLYGSFKVFGINILEMGLAAVLQAKLPNPLWVKGTLGVRFKIFGAERSKSMSVEFGEECDIVVPNPEIDVEVINYIDPLDQTDDVQVDVVPKVLFNLPVDKLYEMEDIAGNQVSFLIGIEEIIIDANGLNIPAKYELDEDKIQAFIHPLYMLPSEDTCTITVKVRIEKGNGNIDYQEKTVTFVTAEGYDHIPPSNVQHAYPIDGMNNLYIDETPSGYVRFKQMQVDLIYENEDFATKLVMSNASGDTKMVDYEVDGVHNRLLFDMPMDFMEPSTYYRFDMVRMPLHMSELISISSMIDGADIESGLVGNTNAEPEEEVKVLYTMYFRTSAYSTFGQKINDIEAQVPFLERELSLTNPSYVSHADIQVNNYALSVQDEMAFDTYEFKGFGESSPLVEVSLEKVDKEEIVDFLIDVATTNHLLESIGYDELVNDALTLGSNGAITTAADMGYEDPGEDPRHDIAASSTIGVSFSEHIYDAYSILKNQLFADAFNFQVGMEECTMNIENSDVDLDELTFCNDPCTNFALGEGASEFLCKWQPQIQDEKYKLVFKYKKPDGTILSTQFITLNY